MIGLINVFNVLLVSEPLLHHLILRMLVSTYDLHRLQSRTRRGRFRIDGFLLRLLGTTSGLSQSAPCPVVNTAEREKMPTEHRNLNLRDDWTWIKQGEP